LSVDLKNDSFSASIFEKGAELASLAAGGRQYVWQGDPAWWSGRAPVLFPVVGTLKDGAYTHDGKRYTLPGHGFARLNDFAVTRREETSADFKLVSNTRTRESYPFDFALTVSFRLKSDGLAVMYKVENAGSARMLFSLGSHPGFNLPFAGGTMDDYYVQFNKPEKDERFFIIPKGGLIDPAHTEKVFGAGNTIRLSKTIFERGALVFKHPKSTSFSLRNDLDSHSLTVFTEGAPYLGLWAAAGAPYVCIEPWHGVNDSTDASGVLSEKEGILPLEPGKAFETGYRILISQP
jgi:galactose mutarotase-like enzyme